MPTRRLYSPLLVLVVALAACGVDTADGESAGQVDTETPATEADPSTTTTTTTTTEDTTTTEPDEPTTTFEVPSTLDTIPPGGDLDDAFRDGMVEGFMEGGLDTEQAECMADVYLEEFNSPESSFPEYEELLELFDQCGVDPNDFGG